MTLTQGLIAKAKFTVYACQEFVSRPIPFMDNLDGDDTSQTIVVHDTGVVVAGVFVPLGHV